MNAREPEGLGWFAMDTDGESAIRVGRGTQPRDWPQIAVESGFAESEADYYDRLRETTIDAARAAVAEREQADDQQLIHAVRALDDCTRMANELTERVAEWAGTHDADASVDSEYVSQLAEGDLGTEMPKPVQSLAGRVAALDAECQSLRSHIEQTAPSVAPNLASLAGPVLAARLIALAGGLEALAKQPAGTVQVLGAEDALFAHLRGRGTSPKHGVIYTHEAVRGTAPEHRGSAARAVAGKLSIAARIDHYRGDLRPALAADLQGRIETIQERDST